MMMEGKSGNSGREANNSSGDNPLLEKEFLDRFASLLRAKSSSAWSDFPSVGSSIDKTGSSMWGGEGIGMDEGDKEVIDVGVEINRDGVVVVNDDEGDEGEEVFDEEDDVDNGDDNDDDEEEKEEDVDVEEADVEEEEEVDDEIGRIVKLGAGMREGD